MEMLGVDGMRSTAATRPAEGVRDGMRTKFRRPNCDRRWRECWNSAHQNEDLVWASAGWRGNFGVSHVWISAVPRYDVPHAKFDSLERTSVEEMRVLASVLCSELREVPPLQSSKMECCLPPPFLFLFFFSFFSFFLDLPTPSARSTNCVCGCFGDPAADRRLH